MAAAGDGAPWPVANRGLAAANPSLSVALVAQQPADAAGVHDFMQPGSPPVLSEASSGGDFAVLAACLLGPPCGMHDEVTSEGPSLAG